MENHCQFSWIHVAQLFQTQRKVNTQSGNHNICVDELFRSYFRCCCDAVISLNWPAAFSRVGRGRRGEWNESC